jgi:CheY-like chemotaxis protein
MGILGHSVRGARQVAKYPDISVVLTGAEAIGGDTVDLRANLTVKGTTAPIPLQAKVAVLDDRAVRLTAQTDIDRKDFGVDGNMMGMIRDAAHSRPTWCSAAPGVARWFSIWRMPESSRPLRILVYSDNPRTREQVQLALGKRVHPELPELTYVEVATGPMVITQMDAGGFDLAILDGEATPVGGMGIAKQLKDELDDSPPILVLTGRPDDAWLAKWSRAEAAVPHPIDPIRLGEAVVSLLRGPAQ